MPGAGLLQGPPRSEVSGRRGPPPPGRPGDQRPPAQGLHLRQSRCASGLPRWSPPRPLPRTGSPTLHCSTFTHPWSLPPSTALTPTQFPHLHRRLGLTPVPAPLRRPHPHPTASAGEGWPLGATAIGAAAAWGTEPRVQETVNPHKSCHSCGLVLKGGLQLAGKCPPEKLLLAVTPPPIHERPPFLDPEGTALAPPSPGPAPPPAPWPCPWYISNSPGPSLLLPIHPQN
ncbi:hypothetical protein mRhiFer1_009460 [Rhinolophus ferrumequinum]|uniref:Uncharacterized protein n=1 Tax=Rhinolophus ferrumequinum TaxID=59479 RepID=A0A7J7RJG9_RHIFE|nr:hypothetical protein mRhiFer1_009460 [Rhinolophus ferrumequinum]